MKTFNKIILAALLLAADVLPATASSAAITKTNLRSTSRDTHAEVTGIASRKEETILEPRNDRRLGVPHPGSGGGGSGSSTSSSGGDSGSSGSSSGSSENSGRSDTGSSGNNSGSTTSSSSKMTTAAASESTPGYQMKDLEYERTDRVSASAVVASFAGLMCLLLLLSMTAIFSHKLIKKEDGIRGIFGNDKKERLVSASLK